jgi:hypothetical protein
MALCPPGHSGLLVVVNERTLHGNIYCCKAKWLVSVICSEMTLDTLQGCLLFQGGIKRKRLNNVPKVFKVQGRTDSLGRYFESVYHEYLWI